MDLTVMSQVIGTVGFPINWNFNNSYLYFVQIF